jgi:hypothetical protein
VIAAPVIRSRSSHLAARVDQLAAENRALRDELATTQRQLL